VLKAVGKFTRANFSYRVLAPEPIATLFSEEAYGARVKVEESNIIAAFNGPMAHIYLTNTADMGKVAEIFRLTMQGEYISEGIKWFNVTEKGYKDLKSSVGRLKSSIDQILVRKDGNYCVFEGLDSNGKASCSSTDPFSSGEYAKAWGRINEMNHPHRSGDIILLMKDDMGNIEQRFTTGTACKSWHGSLNRSDSYVPFILAYPGGNKNEIEKIIKEEGACKEDYSNCKGNWKLVDVVKEIISIQYNNPN
jgi:hypothetical protein